MPARTHIIGAGLAGLSAAIRLAEAGHRVALYEAGPHAGGRCRSYFDEVLDCRIDNGNHLLLSGNHAALDYLKTIGAEDTLTGTSAARFPFYDVRSGERWTLSPGGGRLPFWLLDPKRRVPNTRLSDYLSLLKFARAGETGTVAELVGNNQPLYERFWQPLAVSILNTETETASAKLLWPVLRETLGRGGDYCIPLVARDGLSESFIDPALDWLALRGATLKTGTRIRAIGFDADRAVTLEATGGPFPIEPDDRVVVALPPLVARDLLPGLMTPTEFRPILNAHFKRPDTGAADVSITGIVGGSAEWLFRRGDLISVTVSAATNLIDEPNESLAARFWAEIQATFELNERMPPYRIVKERRATFAQTPQQLKLRPASPTRWGNIVLAGDWTDTGLPATIEGAIRSGVNAANSIRAATA